MSLVGQWETVIEVKAPAAKIHEVFSCRPYIVARTSPGRVQNCELIEGEWDGRNQTPKEMVEVIDNENYLTNFKLIDGHTLDLYKSFNSIAKVTQKDGGSLVHFTYKYEKQNENIPDLESKILHMMIAVVKDFDAYLTRPE